MQNMESPKGKFECFLIVGYDSQPAEYAIFS